MSKLVASIARLEARVDSDGFNSLSFGEQVDLEKMLNTAITKLADLEAAEQRSTTTFDSTSISAKPSSSSSSSAAAAPSRSQSFAILSTKTSGSCKSFDSQRVDCNRSIQINTLNNNNHRIIVGSSLPSSSLSPAICDAKQQQLLSASENRLQALIPEPEKLEQYISSGKHVKQSGSRKQLQDLIRPVAQKYY
jgi:hypothetical protein